MRRAGARIAALTTTLWVAACSGVGPPAVGPAPGPAAGGAELGAPAPEGVEPWAIPPEEVGTQRLLRLRYGGPEGEGSLRLVLRLAAPDNYRASAADLVGRALWSLSVEGDEGLWLDHRGRAFCRFQGSFELEAFPLGPFEPTSLAALLLGRLPVPVVAAGSGGDGEAGERVVRDAYGRRWTLTLEPRTGLLSRWTLWQAGEPEAWWHRQGREAILSHRRGLQVRWQLVTPEPLSELPPVPPVPDGYARRCGAAFGGI